MIGVENILGRKHLGKKILQKSMAFTKVHKCNILNSKEKSLISMLSKVNRNGEKQTVVLPRAHFRNIRTPTIRHCLKNSEKAVSLLVTLISPFLCPKINALWIICMSQV